MDKSFRPLRMLGAVTALLVSLFALALAVEIFLEEYMDLVQYRTHMTSYGWGILARALNRVALAGGLFWVFARLGGSKPFPRLARSHLPPPART